jgi:hypothetical protein
MDDESGKRPEHKPIKKGNWQKLELAWDSLFEFFSLTKFGNTLKGEILKIKNQAPILTCSMLLAICFLAWRGCDKDSHISKLEFVNRESARLSDDTIKSQNITIGNLSSVIQSNSASVQTLNQQLRDKESENQKLFAEKNKAEEEAEIANNAVASWQLLAKSGNTNTPLTERLDSLIKGVAKNTESLSQAFGGSVNTSNLLAAIESDKPSFELYINNTLVTNGSVVSLKDTRRLQLAVKNISPVTADNLSIDFGVPSGVEPTNVIYDDSWRAEPPNRIVTNGMIATNVWGHHWSWRADSNFGSDTFYGVNYLEFSTNITFSVIQTQFYVYAVRSTRQTYKITFTF